MKQINGQHDGTLGDLRLRQALPGKWQHRRLRRRAWARSKPQPAAASCRAACDEYKKQQL